MGPSQLAHTGNSLLVSGISNSSAHLGLSLVRSLSASRRDNILISPVSVQIILNLILLGAKWESKTEQELVKFLDYHQHQHQHQDSRAGTQSAPDEAKNSPHEGLRQVLELVAKSVETSTGLKFDLANLILAGKQPLPEYSKAVDKFYRNTKSEQFSSSTNPKELLARINSWVSSATKGHITSLGDHLDLSSPNLAMVLVNAAYFQGQWLHQFDVDQTADKPFYNHGQESQQKKIPFMQRTGSFKVVDFTAVQPTKPAAGQPELSKAETEYLRVAERLDCRAISMPFSANKGNELDMVAVLPNKRDGLASLLANLGDSELKTLLKELDMEPTAKTRVELPRFSFETTYDIKSVMQELGVNEVFADAAQLDRMFKGVQVHVSQLLHKAKISVDEKGAEAAAATVATVSMRSSSWPPRQPFKADHPFVFLIRHKPTGLVTFLGSVVRF